MASVTETRGSSWLPSFRVGWNKTVRIVNTIAFVMLTCLFLNQIQAAEGFGKMINFANMGECIHACKQELFGGKNKWWSNGVCGAKCAIFDWGIPINEGIPLGGGQRDPRAGPW